MINTDVFTQTLNNALLGNLIIVLSDSKFVVMDCDWQELNSSQISRILTILTETNKDFAWFDGDPYHGNKPFRCLGMRLLRDGSLELNVEGNTRNKIISRWQSKLTKFFGRPTKLTPISRESLSV